MNSAQFLEILQKADSISPVELDQLQRVQENFPYFQIPYILRARYEYQTKAIAPSSALAFAAITSPDRVWLKQLIEKKAEHKTAAQGKKQIEYIKGISKREVKLESIKELDVAENLIAGNTPLRYNLSAASMRVTIVFEVEYTSPINEKETLKKPLTFFKDYDPKSTTFPQVEAAMMNEIFKIIQDIFASTASNLNYTYIEAKKNSPVNASQFLEIIQKGDTLDRNELLQLQKVQENFPYFQIPHVLTARYEFLKDSSQKPAALGYAAITSPDRIWLKTLIQRTDQDSSKGPEPTFKPAVKPEATQASPISSTAVEVTTEPVKPKPKRRKPPKDDLIETIKQKEKKVILDEKKKEQMDLIKAFSKKSIKLATIKEIEANQNTENLAAASTTINDKLMSESYAKILASQGKKQLAKEIYEKLVLKFPDKRAYFADLIEKLKD
ncbi:hypothetical protein [Algoriphagus sp.]|uniref:hypothetical protein n=1 Tax=Algoriphagus sp. TaxID=1872435 RepID=UPI00326D90CC